MRFLLSEHQSVLSILKNGGWEKDTVTFRKKSGWLQIHLSGRSETFAFHRKKKVDLVDGQFVKGIDYFVRRHHKQLQVSNWGDVEEELMRWVHGLAIGK